MSRRETFVAPFRWARTGIAVNVFLILLAGVAFLVSVNR